MQRLLLFRENYIIIFISFKGAQMLQNCIWAPFLTALLLFTLERIGSVYKRHKK